MFIKLLQVFIMFAAQPTLHWLSLLVVLLPSLKSLVIKGPTPPITTHQAEKKNSIINDFGEWKGKAGFLVVSNWELCSIFYWQSSVFPKLFFCLIHWPDTLTCILHCTRYTMYIVQCTLSSLSFLKLHTSEG